MEQLFQAILPIALGGVVATVVTSVLNVRRERNLMMRTKAEQLVLAVDVYGRGLGSYFITHYPVIKGEMSYDDLHDLLIKQDNADMKEASKVLVMLIKLYFPAIEPSYQKLLSVRGKGNAIISAHKREYKRHGYAEAFEKFHAFTAELNNELEALTNAAIAAGRKHTR